MINFRNLKGNVLTLMERKMRFTLTASLQTKTANETAQAIQDRLSFLSKYALRTIIFDNGGEFSHFEKLESSLSVVTYFCDPHSPW